MIRFQIMGKNPVEMHTAAKSVVAYYRYELVSDSGNRPGRREGYIRYIHVKVNRMCGSAKRDPKRWVEPTAPPKRPDAAELAKKVWDKLVHDTDSDDEAVGVIMKLIEAERGVLTKQGKQPKQGKQVNKLNSRSRK